MRKLAYLAERRGTTPGATNTSDIAGAKLGMRLYIHKIVQHVETRKPTTFEFRKAIEIAWFWKTREAAERALLIWKGISVQGPFGRMSDCTDFRIEPRPRGGFVISCEHPSRFKTIFFRLRGIAQQGLVSAQFQ